MAQSCSCQEPHSHQHAHPNAPQMMAPQIDPGMQARIDASFHPVDLAIGGPAHAFAFCQNHKREKCTDCNVDFSSLNRISKIFITNPSLRCPPPPTVVQQKLSQAVTNTKDEGNVRMVFTDLFGSRFDSRARTCIKWESIKKHSPNTTLPPILQCSDHLGKTPRCSARNSPPSCLTGLPLFSSSVTTSVHWSTQRQSSLSAETGQKVTSGRQKPLLGSEGWRKQRRLYHSASNSNPTTPCVCRDWS